MNKNKLNLRCDNCNSKLQNKIEKWLLYCDSCGLYKSLLNDEKYNGKYTIGWTESASNFLGNLREHNANKTLKELSKHLTLESKHLLDIGCAAGWFLDVAKRFNMIVTGLEPDKNIAIKGINKGLDIKTVPFPDRSITGIKFDVITFNDVFEHIENPREILFQIHEQLNNDGYLMINLPVSNGIIYKTSRLFAKFGYTPLLERLWQKGYFSPHLYYYSHNNLKSLVEKHGFKLLVQDKLDVIHINGLWERINHNKAINIIVSGTIYLSMLMAYPLIKYILPSDIMFHIYRKV